MLELWGCRLPAGEPPRLLSRCLVDPPTNARTFRQPRVTLNLSVFACRRQHWAVTEKNAGLLCLFALYFVCLSVDGLTIASLMPAQHQNRSSQGVKLYVLVKPSGAGAKPAHNEQVSPFTPSRRDHYWVSVGFSGVLPLHIIRVRASSL